MISVDCSNALSIKDKLLASVADKLEALPILKYDKFFLDPIDKTFDKLDVIAAIEEFLESIDMKKNFQVVPKGDDIKIEPLDGPNMKEKLEKISDNENNPFFECTHCGFMTRYEEELRTHMLIHYL